MNRQQQAVPPAPPKAPKLPVFEVTKITPMESGTLVCFADVLVGRGPNAIEICKFRLIQQPNQRPWLSAPQETWVSESGDRRYTNIVKIPKAWNLPLTETVIAAWEAHKQVEVQEAAR